MAWAPPALLHCLARSTTVHMALCPGAGKGGIQEAGSSQPHSLGAHPIPCSQSTPNAHGWRLAACRAQQGPNSLKTGPGYDRGGNGDGTTVWGFLSQCHTVVKGAQGNLSIRSCSVWRSSSVHFPREQPNKQPNCGRGRNLELVVEAGSWQNKLYMSQRARKGATRGSVTAAQGLQQSWEGNKAWHIPISMAVCPSEPMQKTVQNQM